MQTQRDTENLWPWYVQRVLWVLGGLAIACTLFAANRGTQSDLTRLGIACLIGSFAVGSAWARWQDKVQRAAWVLGALLVLMAIYVSTAGAATFLTRAGIFLLLAGFVFSL